MAACARKPRQESRYATLERQLLFLLKERARLFRQQTFALQALALECCAFGLYGF